MNKYEKQEIQDEVCRRAIEKYGEILQMDQCIEECAELIQAINKFKRKRRSIDTLTNLAEEAADVKIMVRQMEMILNDINVDDWVAFKIKRLADRLEDDDETSKNR